MERHARILIVEDEHNWQDLLTNILGEEHYAVEIAPTYDEALAGLHRQSFDLAIVDLRLSPTDEENRDGMTLLGDSLRQGVPTVVVTGYGTIMTVKRVFEEYKVSTFFDKAAFDAAEFRERVKETIARKLEPESLVSPPFSEKQKALLKTAKGYYMEAYRVIRNREEQYRKWLEAVGGEKQRPSLDGSRQREERDLRKLEELYGESKRKVEQAQSPQEWEVLELEIVREGENWKPRFSKLSAN